MGDYDKFTVTYFDSRIRLMKIEQNLEKITLLVLSSLSWILFLFISPRLILLSTAMFIAAIINKNKIISRLLISGLVLSTIINFILYFDTSFIILNRAEHVYWALIISLIAFEDFKQNKLFTHFYERLFVIFSLVNTLGVVKEIFDFATRYLVGLMNIDYYSDSIGDLTANLVGATVGALIIFYINKIQSKEK